MPSTLDIAWAAGFLEGEGCFTWKKSGKKYGHPRITVDQVDLEPLGQLKALFGGNILGPYNTKGQPKYRWEISSWRAAAVQMTIFSLMSRRRQETIAAGLEKWKLTPPWGGNRKGTRDE